ncbi:MAG: electron transfer flavoprotein subunit beta/FixA family protein [Bacteroidetes bacterium]|nr:electron transfer flavoprotein subunit beta/FixA family protein [Bacteroidota bacterium]
MKILVCISKVPDTTTKINFVDDNTRFDTNNVQFIINPLDEFALTRAIELIEAGEGSVEVINVGGVDTEPIIRKALALGAEEAIRVDAEPTDSFFVATQIAHFAKVGEYDIVLTGRETIDFNGSQVGGMIAAMLDIPFISGVSSLELNGNEATFHREIEGGKEVVTSSIPFVASAQEGITTPRIPNMRGIMSARTKPLKVEQPVSDEKLTSNNLFESPPAKGECVFIDSETPEKLVELLHSEAKVI